MSSIFLLFFLLLIAVFFAFIKRTFLCQLILLFSCIYIILIGSGLLPYYLLKPLQASFIDLPSPKWRKNNAIILLGGGTIQLPGAKIYNPGTFAYSRIYKTAELYFSCKRYHACKIIISGGPINHTEKSDALVYEKALMKLSIPQDDFILELNSSDTQTNAQFVNAILEKSSFDQIVLVTSGIHMKRATLWFAHFGIDAIPVISDYSHPYFNVMSLGNNFALTDFALHEYLGIVEVYLYHFI